jgi:flagellar biosynthesis protein FliR
MYEHRSEPLLPKEKFIRRVTFHALVAACGIVVSLGIGVFGYHFLEGLSWLDALLNASMILGGMGPVDPIQSTAGKLFASFYSLFAGIGFLVIAGILVAPIAHRFLHRLHLEGGRGSK